MVQIINYYLFINRTPYTITKNVIYIYIYIYIYKNFTSVMSLHLIKINE